jgi:ABC-type sugar transport system permease subunit
MATSDLLSEAGFSLPKISTSSLSTWFMIILLGIFMAGLFVILIYLYFDKLKYNKIIPLFKRINGHPTLVGTYRACFERIGSAGDYWCKIRKVNKIIARPKIEISKNMYWHWQREDGEWINFGLEDVDTKQQAAKVHYIDEDMRLSRISIEKLLELRYNKQTFWQKYGTTIIFVLFVIIVTVCLIVLFSNLTKLTKELPTLAKSLESLANSIKDANMNRTGLISAGQLS